MDRIPAARLMAVLGNRSDSFSFCRFGLIFNVRVGITKIHLVYEVYDELLFKLPDRGLLRLSVLVVVHQPGQQGSEGGVGLQQHQQPQHQLAGRQQCQQFISLPEGTLFLHDYWRQLPEQRSL